jgi:hypothetical protein
MLRAKPACWCALGATLGAACLTPDALTTTDNAPLIGRLQTREGVTELNVNSFADGPNAVPTNTHARVVADIERDVRHDHARDRSDDTTDDNQFEATRRPR